MFAVIKTGGKQYKVAKDDVLKVEKLSASPGENVQFNEVLMLGGDNVTVGDPTIEGAAVQAEVLEQGRAAKVWNFKKRRRKHGSQRLKGHRQYITTVRVTDILASGASVTAVAAATGAGEAAEESDKQSDMMSEAPVAETGKRPPNLLDAPRGDADDLTKISGIGPGLNEKLNQNGVFHFWQIADWHAEEIAYMDDQLSFKGRIERDNWIGQAKEFAAEAEGSSGDAE